MTSRVYKEGLVKVAAVVFTPRPFKYEHQLIIFAGPKGQNVIYGFLWPTLRRHVGSLDSSSPDTDIYATMFMINSWSRPPPLYTITQRAGYVLYRWYVHLFLKGWHLKYYHSGIWVNHDSVKQQTQFVKFSVRILVLGFFLKKLHLYFHFLRGHYSCFIGFILKSWHCCNHQFRPQQI